jgi:hypothetical protein
LPFRCRGSRRESAVAQLFSLGGLTTMNTAKMTIGLLGLALVASFLFSTSRWFRLTLSGILAFILLLVFFPGIALFLVFLAASISFFYRVIASLRDGEITFGRYSSFSTYYRDKNPFGYWFYVFFGFCIGVVTFAFMIHFFMHHPIFYLSYDLIAA